MELEFIPMINVIPEINDGISRFYTKHIVISAEKAKAERLKAYLDEDWTKYNTTAGTYLCLFERGKYCWMSDTPFERDTNRHVLDKANGHVLIVGLGIGMIPVALAQLDKVKSITILEREQEIIDLISPYIQNHKIRIICGDAQYPPFNTKSFDYIYLDICPTVDLDNWNEMKLLLRKYRKLGFYVDAWLKDFIQKEAIKYHNNTSSALFKRLFIRS